MKLKNFLIVVRDVEKSKKFYEEIFGLYVMRDFGENVILSQGLVLQEANVWKEAISEDVAYGNDTALYFEENDFDGFLNKLQGNKWNIKIIDSTLQSDETSRVIRIRDLDGHIIEVREYKGKH